MATYRLTVKYWDHKWPKHDQMPQFAKVIEARRTKGRDEAMIKEVETYLKAVKPHPSDNVGVARVEVSVFTGPQTLAMWKADKGTWVRQ